MNKRAIALLAALSGVFVVLNGKTLLSSDVQNAQSVYSMAGDIVRRYNLNADPLMITAMAKIESSFNPSAVRVEPHIADASIGLMQTLTRTAQWLAQDFPRYSARGVPSSTDLLNPATSLYFGACYIDYLSKWRGVGRSEQWIVESYNGGPGKSNTQTQNHYDKYMKAKAEIIKELG